VGKSTIEELKLLAAKLSGKVVQNINSTFTGGGVAEILSRMVPLLQQLGVDARWSIIQGNVDFYQVTKKFHNALHGRPERITEQDYALFKETTREILKNWSSLEILSMCTTRSRGSHQPEKRDRQEMDLAVSY